jgi:hypothetical protein
MKSVYYGMFAFALMSTASVLYANELKDACYSLSSWLTKIERTVSAGTQTIPTLVPARDVAKQAMLSLRVV